MKKTIFLILLFFAPIFLLSKRGGGESSKAKISIINKAKKAALIMAHYNKRTLAVTNSLCPGCDIFLAPTNPALGDIQEIKISNNPDKSSQTIIKNPEIGRLYKITYKNNKWHYK